MSCPSDWNYFDNPALHYGLCYPKDWGFTDHEQPDPLDSIPSADLIYLRLSSPDGFPWRAGTAKNETDSIEIQLTLLDKDASLAGNACLPETELNVGRGAVATWCEATFDMPVPPQTTPNPTGAFYGLIAVIELRQTPSGTPIERDLTGSRLGFLADTSGARFRSEPAVRDTIMRILESTTPY